MTVVWLVLFVIFLVIEGMTVSLTCLWFAGGALAGLAVQAAGGGLYLQLAVFAVVSLLLLIMVRPLAAACVQKRKTPTNVDSLPGRQAVIKERVDNSAGTGTAVLGSSTWLARSESGQILEPGQSVVVAEVKGAKLIVRAQEVSNE